MDDLDVGRFVIKADDLDERFETSGGPGGQHSNRNSTSVRLRIHVADSEIPTEFKQRLISELGEVVEVVAADSRSQFRNRAIARRRMKERIEEALAERPPRRRTRATRASKRRRLEKKRARSETKRLRRRPTRED